MKTNMSMQICRETFSDELKTITASSSFDIEISSDINTIQKDWEQLENDDILTPFQKKAWLGPLYTILAPHLGAIPILLLVRDTLTRRPMMLLPLCSRRYYGISVIEFADMGVSDYNAPILAKAFNPSPAEWQNLWQRIIKSLKKGSILWLKKMPELINGVPNPLVKYGQRHKLMDISSWGISLPATYNAYMKSVLHPTFSKELAKKFRRVAKRGPMEYTIAQTPEEKRAAFNVLARQRQTRCDDMGRSNNMAQLIYRQFYEFVAIESSDSLVNIGMYKVSGNIVGTVLTLNHHKSLHIIVSTFEGGEWKSCSLGNVIMASAVENAIEKGMRFFDLTIGDENYKQHFGTTPSSLYYTLQPLTPLGSPAAIFMGLGGYFRKKAVPLIQKVEKGIRKIIPAKRNDSQENILTAG